MDEEQISDLRSYDHRAWSTQSAADLLNEIHLLQAWKTEATTILARWDEVAAMVPLRGSDLGRSKADVVKEYIQQAEIERLRVLVRSGHVYNAGLAFGDTLVGGCSCGFRIELKGRSQFGNGPGLHAVHVEAILDGETGAVDALSNKSTSCAPG